MNILSQYLVALHFFSQFKTFFRFVLLFVHHFRFDYGRKLNHEQVRSTSFDEFQLEANRTATEFSDSADDSPAALLQVPHVQFGAQRSKSVESGSIDTSVASYLEIPKRFQRRRSSNLKSPAPCVHCLCVDEYEREKNSYLDEPHSTSDTSSISDDDDTDESDNIEQTDKQFLTIPLTPPNCNIRFSISSIDSFPLQSAKDVQDSPPTTVDQSCEVRTPSIDIDELPAQPPPCRARRRSISRQEAIFIEPTGSSLENLDSVKSPTDSERKITSKINDHVTTSEDSNDYVQDFYLTVPETDLRRDRAASVDSSFSKLSSNGKTEEPKIDGFLSVPTNAVRSRSVDIVLPTNEQARYKALSLGGPSMSKRYVILKIQKQKQKNVILLFFLPQRQEIKKKRTLLDEIVLSLEQISNFLDQNTFFEKIYHLRN